MKFCCMETETVFKHPIFVEDFGTYSWCLHCEQAGLTEEWFAKEACPYCDTSLYDQWRWEKVRESNPDYPEAPEIGAEYPLYGHAGEGK